MIDNTFFEDPIDSLPEALRNYELTTKELRICQILSVLNPKGPKRTHIETIMSVLRPSLSELTIKKSHITTIINDIQKKGLLVQVLAGFCMNPLVVNNIALHARKEMEIMGLIRIYLTPMHRNQQSKVYIRFSLLIQDDDFFNQYINENVFLDQFYNIELIIESMMELGGLKYSHTLLHQLDSTQKHLFYNVYVKHLHLYPHMSNDFVEHFSNVDLSFKEDLIYNYLSFANLYLNPQQIVEHARILDADEDASFYVELLRGNTNTALKMANNFLIRQQFEHVHKRKELPGLFGLLYGIALIKQGEPKSLTLATTFIKNTIKEIPRGEMEIDLAHRYFANGLIKFASMKMGKQRFELWEASNGAKNQASEIYKNTLLTWIGEPCKDLVLADEKNLQSKYFKDPRATSDRIKYEQQYHLANSIDSAQGEEVVQHMQQQLGIVPLASLFAPEAPWKEVLNLLTTTATEINQPKVSIDNSKKRIIWHFNPMASDLKAMEQNQTKSGWSKGRLRSIESLKKTVPSYLSKSDIQVLSICQDKKSFFGRTLFDEEKMFQYLSTHPHVYHAEPPHKALEIRIEYAQLIAEKVAQGTRVTIAPRDRKNPITRESEQRYVFTIWSKHLHLIINKLEQLDVPEIMIPLSENKQVKQLIQQIEKEIPVRGNLSSTETQQIESEGKLIVQLTPEGENLHIEVLVRPIETEPLTLVPGQGTQHINLKTKNGTPLRIERDKQAEINNFTTLCRKIPLLKSLNIENTELDTEDNLEILDFLRDLRALAPEVDVIWPKGERIKVSKVLHRGDLTIEVNQNNQWFTVDGKLQINDDVVITLQQLLKQSVDQRLNYIKLDDNHYIALENKLRNKIEAFASVATTNNGDVEIHHLAHHALEQLIDEVPNVIVDNGWKAHLQKMDVLRNYQPSLPNGLDAELRPYQVDGVFWLDRLYAWGVGACLADDMGLGKTIQAIAILLKHAQEGPSVVLAPSSVCGNWHKEIRRFAPGLRTHQLKSQNRTQTIESLQANDVLILSYGLIQSNPSLLAERSWNIAILDEAHAIKNANSIRSKAVMQLRAKFRLLTTGTPIQNHIGEIWNLFQFLNPHMLGSYAEFKDRYVQPVNDDLARKKRSALNRCISPFILRRNKHDVLDDLPQKTEIALKVQLSEGERNIYEAIRQNAVAQIEENKKSGGSKHLQILAEITKLRQASCHPQLVIPNSDVPSAKLEALETLIDDLRSAGHQALIFSQFTSHLQLIQKMLQRNGLSHQYLDGSCSIQQREAAITAFQSGQSDLFLISLKAGGVGLNLTAADYVIHMDPWWNPAIEDQASDRAYRIGQTRPVTIYRMLAEDTIEEKIVELHHKKRDLADHLLKGTSQSANISSEALFQLMK